MADKVILTCSECLSRNYVTTKNKKTNTQRLEKLKSIVQNVGNILYIKKQSRKGIVMAKEKKEKKERTYSPKGNRRE